MYFFINIIMACKCNCGIKIDMFQLIRLLAWGCIVFYFANKYVAKKESDGSIKSKTTAEKKI